MKTSKADKVVIFDGPDPPPDMPQDLRAVLFEKIEGYSPETKRLLIQKKLEVTDLKDGQNRISMPLNQIGEDDFLTTEEKIDMNTRIMRGRKSLLKGLEVCCVDTLLRIGKFTLRKWNYDSSSSYVISTKKWKKFLAETKFKVDDLIQIWFFRANNNPGIAMVRLESG